MSWDVPYMINLSVIMKNGSKWVANHDEVTVKI